MTTMKFNLSRTASDCGDAICCFARCVVRFSRRPPTRVSRAVQGGSGSDASVVLFQYSVTLSCSGAGSVQSTVRAFFEELVTCEFIITVTRFQRCALHIQYGTRSDARQLYVLSRFETHAYTCGTCVGSISTVDGHAELGQTPT